LIQADASELRKLADDLRLLASGKRVKFEISGRATGRGAVPASIVAHLNDQGKGLKKESTKGRLVNFAWALPSEAWDSYARLVSVLADRPSGHQYLEAQGDDAIVIVSTGESQSERTR
jgi:hypothetical protein